MNAVAELRYARDLRMVRQARDGASSNFERLYQRYRPMLWRVADRYFLPNGDDHDLRQEALIGFYKAVRDYDGISSSFNSFAQLCAVRQVITAVKTATRLKQRTLNHATSLDQRRGDADTEMTLSDVVLDRTPSAVERLIGRDELREVLKVLTQDLSKLELKVFSLWFDDVSYIQIAEELSIDTKTVDNALQRVKRKLAEVRRAIRAQPSLKSLPKTEIERSPMSTQLSPPRQLAGSEILRYRRRNPKEFARDALKFCEDVAEGVLDHCQLTQGTTTRARVVPVSWLNGSTPGQLVTVDELRNPQRVEELIREVGNGLPAVITTGSRQLAVMVGEDAEQSPARPLALVPSTEAETRVTEVADGSADADMSAAPLLTVHDLSATLDDAGLTRPRQHRFLHILLALERAEGKVTERQGSAAAKLRNMLPEEFRRSKESFAVDLVDLCKLELISRNTQGKRTYTIQLLTRLSPDLIAWMETALRGSEEPVGQVASAQVASIPSPAPEAVPAIEAEPPERHEAPEPVSPVEPLRPVQPIAELAPSQGYRAQAADAMARAEQELTAGHESRSQLLLDFADRYIRLAELEARSTT